MKQPTPLKVAVVYHYFAHYRSPIFTELMQTKDIEYTLFSDNGSGNDIKTMDSKLANIAVEDGGLRWSFFKNKWLYKNVLLWQKGMVSMSMKSKFDVYVLLGNSYFISTWFAAAILRIRGKRIYFWTHGVTSDEKGFKWWFRKVFYKLAHGMLLYGHGAKKIMAKKGFAEKNLHVIYNSLDHKSQLANRAKIELINADEVKKTLFAEPNLPLIMFVGRLTFHKKLEQIIEAVDILQKEQFKVNVLFVGDGEAKDMLMKLVAEQNIQQYYHFYGACYDEMELCKLLFISDICVSPGEVGLSAITSLGYGTPVISHNDFNYQMPEYETIIPGVNGDLFERNSTFALANKIKAWITSHKDVPAQTIRENCYRVVDEKYNPTHQAEIINKILLNHE